MYKFKKLNDESIEIESILDEHDEANDYEPSFWFDNKRWYLSDFIRVHNNPWLSLDDFPDYIHGMLNDGSWRMYERPLFVELCDDGEHVNVYEEVEYGEE